MKLMFQNKIYNSLLKLKVLGRIAVGIDNSQRAFTAANFKTSRAFSSNMSESNFCDKIVWMDLEMTGLDIKHDKILEVSCLITDKNLNILSNGLSFVIHAEKKLLDNMGDWCKKHHNESGLVQKSLESQITMEKAENMLLEFLIEQRIPKKKVPLAGNSIYMDRLFIRDQLPRVDDYLHYRVIDVSTIKELARRWNPAVLKSAPKKAFKHRTLEDIKDSIAELKFYRESFFKCED